MKNRKVGVCHICGENRELTFEHIPPKSAFNNSNVKLYNYVDIHASGNDCWDFSGVRYTQHQKGNGSYTLCSQCNNDIGSWYVVAYADFIVELYNAIKNHSFRQGNKFCVYAQGIYPLRIFKSVLAMFCSINTEKFADIAKIRKLLLIKEEKGLNSNFGIAMYFAIGCVMRQLPISGAIDLSINSQRVTSELSWFPFGYIFDIDRKNIKEDFDITDFSKYDYEEKADIRIMLMTREVNTPFPLDFRNQQQVVEDREASMTATSSIS